MNENQNPYSTTQTPVQVETKSKGPQWVERPIRLSVFLSVGLYVLGWVGVHLVQGVVKAGDLDILGLVFYLCSVIPIAPMSIFLVGLAWSLVRRFRDD